jgi:hypothetical protein
MTRMGVAIARDRGCDLAHSVWSACENFDPQPSRKGATPATTTVAIIDVFRAFITAAVVLANEDSAV